MEKHNRHPASSLAFATAPALDPVLPPPGLAKCGPRPVGSPVGSPRSKALRAEADRVARAIIEEAFRRTGPTAVAVELGLSRSVVRGWAEQNGLSLTVRDVLAGPRSFARDVLEGALAVVDEDVPDTLDGLERLAERLVCAAAELLRLAMAGQNDSVTRRLILALIDQVEKIAQQIRRQLLSTKGGV